MDRAGWHYPTGDLRVSDGDRDRALSELTQAFQVGRLTADELITDPGMPWAPTPGTNTPEPRRRPQEHSDEDRISATSAAQSPHERPRLGVRDVHGVRRI